MLLVETQPVVGRLYGFTYGSAPKESGQQKLSNFFSRKPQVADKPVKTKRLVLVQRVDADGIFGHDFLANGPRNFKFDKIESAKDFSDKLLVEESYPGVEQYYQDKGCLTYLDEEKELAFVVNYKN